MNGQSRVRIVLQGVVQGVGFRPFVYSLANEMNITGWVNNSSIGLCIEAESEKPVLDIFIARLHAEKPKLSHIYTEETTFLDPLGYSGFTIQESDDRLEPTVLILPDIATCDECLKEMSDPSNRRYQYPFINCTHCGPRYSIIRSLPYDRPNTTMASFALCTECEKEYTDPGDRRFHAQPIACPVCGPHIEIWDRSGSALCTKSDAIRETVIALKSGKIIALKGLGGFQLLADATNERAVDELRKRKLREEKPFALMAKNIDMVRGLCSVSDAEERLLRSAASPIVLLRKTDSNNSVVGSVAPRNPHLGIMLPYTPLHHLFMNDLDVPIVATSGNISDEPMCIDEHDALRKLGSIADLFLVHNRPIRRYIDDSIIRIIDGQEMIMRRARGYAPLPLLTKHKTEKHILAVGGHLKNTVAMQKNNTVFVSQHIGDLESLPAFECFKETINDVHALYKMDPAIIIHDEHPDYVSTHFAQKHAGEQFPVQHHIAHIASCMAEHELNEPLLGVSWDGTGFGSDGTIWGGEFILFDGTSFSRVGSFAPFMIPGGDAVIKESFRSAIGMLYALSGKNVFQNKIFRDLISKEDERVFLTMLQKKMNSPLTSSVGRIFDGVSAILGIRHRSQFEGQAAMELEFASYNCTDLLEYPFSISDSAADFFHIDWHEIIRSIIREKDEGLSVNIIARRFHNTLTAIIVETARKIGMKKVVLSGGCFQNAELLENSIRLLSAKGFLPYRHQRIPTNDGGISVGQIYVYHLSLNR